MRRCTGVSISKDDGLFDDTNGRFGRWFRQSYPTHNHAPSLASVFSGGVLAAFFCFDTITTGFGCSSFGTARLPRHLAVTGLRIIVQEKEERHIDGLPVSGGDSTVIVEGVFLLSKFGVSIYWVHGQILGAVQANKDISWSDGLFLIFYTHETLGNGWLELVAFGAV